MDDVYEKELELTTQDSVECHRYFWWRQAYSLSLMLAAERPHLGPEVGADGKGLWVASGIELQEPSWFYGYMSATYDRIATGDKNGVLSTGVGEKMDPQKTMYRKSSVWKGTKL